MNDRPGASELLEAVGRFLREDVVAALTGPAKYHARVAAHVVSMVGREIASEERQLRGEWHRLARLFEASDPEPIGREALCEEIRSCTLHLVEDIRAGRADRGPWRQAVLAHLEQTVADKLEVAKASPS